MYMMPFSILIFAMCLALVNCLGEYDGKYTVDQVPYNIEGKDLSLSGSVYNHNDSNSTIHDILKGFNASLFDLLLSQTFPNITDGVVIFAFDDEAVSKLPKNIQEEMSNNKTFRDQILRHHILNGTAFLHKKLGNGTRLQSMLQGDKLVFNNYSCCGENDTISVNGIEIVHSYREKNVGIFIIKEVLYPIPIFDDLYSFLEQGSSSTLIFNLLVNLAGKGFTTHNYTVFIPQSISNVDYTEFMHILSDEKALRKFVERHTFPPYIFSSQLKHEDCVTNNLNETWHILKDPLSQAIKLNGSTILMSDTLTKSSVFHIIDYPLQCDHITPSLY